MNGEGEKAIKEMLELLNNGWERTGEGTYTKGGYTPLTRADAIEVQRASGSALGLCPESIDDTSNSTV